MGLPHGRQGPEHWAIFLCFARHLSRKLDHEQRSRSSLSLAAVIFKPKRHDFPPLEKIAFSVFMDFMLNHNKDDYNMTHMTELPMTQKAYYLKFIHEGNRKVICIFP